MTTNDFNVAIDEIAKPFRKEVAKSIAEKYSGHIPRLVGFLANEVRKIGTSYFSRYSFCFAFRLYNFTSRPPNT
jgi:hypothetical protein